MKENNGEKDLLEFLSDKSLIHSSVPSIRKIIDEIDHRSEITIVYGETYDKFGLTIDSLKYYFFISLFHELIEKTGKKVRSFVIMGDTHSVQNKIVVDKKDLLARTKEIADTIAEIKGVYHLKFTPLLMSSMLQSDDFLRNLNIVKPIFDRSKRFQDIARRTVLQNRITQEEVAGFQYTIEEVALIFQYDIKIGPPREVNYDKLAHLIEKRLGRTCLISVYLKPTYPLGLSFDYFVCNQEVEKYGLTPYKAGSNKMENNRIVLGKTTLEEIKELIGKSFIPNNLSLPNPILDLFIIANMAKVFLDRSYKFNYQENLSTPETLQESTFNDLRTYVFKPLNINY